MSRFVGFLALAASALSVMSGLLGGIRPNVALVLSGLAAAIGSFTERVQGGVSKIEGQ